MTPKQVKMLRAMELLLDDNELEILECRTALSLSEGMTRAMVSRLYDAESPNRIAMRIRGIERAYAVQARRRAQLVVAKTNRRALMDSLTGGAK